MSDEFDHWLRTAFKPSEDGAGVWCAVSTPDFTFEQVRRLIAFLHRLSGHAPGALPAGELEAIRERRKLGSVYCAKAWKEVDALLAHADALAADLAAAEGEVEGLRLLVADLVHPEGDGREEQARCYRQGAEDATRRCVGLVRGRGADFRAEARTPGYLPDVAGLCVAVADALDSAAAEVESPPAPAAAPKGE